MVVAMMVVAWRQILSGLVAKVKMAKMTKM